MELKIGDFNVTITAKNSWLQNSNTEEDTMDFLCRLANVLYDSAQYSKRAGYEHTAEHRDSIATDIYNVLDKAGYFNDIRETA